MNNFSVKELKSIDIRSRSRETKFNSLGRHLKIWGEKTLSSIARDNVYFLEVPGNEDLSILIKKENDNIIIAGSTNHNREFNSLSFWKVEVGPDGDIVQAYYSRPKVNSNKIIPKKMTEVFVVPRNGMEYVNPHRARAFLDVFSSYIRAIK